jgi:hypothetical protein
LGDYQQAAVLLVILPIKQGEGRRNLYPHHMSDTSPISTSSANIGQKYKSTYYLLSFSTSPFSFSLLDGNRLVGPVIKNNVKLVNSNRKIMILSSF